MTDEIKQLEYRVQTTGNAMLGTRDVNIQKTLVIWGKEGREAINVHTPSGNSRITIVAKLPLTKRMLLSSK